MSDELPLLPLQRPSPQRMRKFIREVEPELARLREELWHTPPDAPIRRLYAASKARVEEYRRLLAEREAAPPRENKRRR